MKKREIDVINQLEILDFKTDECKKITKKRNGIQRKNLNKQ